MKNDTLADGSYPIYTCSICGCCHGYIVEDGKPFRVSSCDCSPADYAYEVSVEEFNSAISRNRQSSN